MATSPLRLTELEVRFYGGAIATELDDSVSHVVCDEW